MAVRFNVKSLPASSSPYGLRRQLMLTGLKYSHCGGRKVAEASQTMRGRKYSSLIKKAMCSQNKHEAGKSQIA